MFAGRAEVRLADGPPGAPVIAVELARTKDERSQGLMFRRQLADNAGMLFVMPGDDDWGFYMRNTYIALDMVFVDRDGVVVGVIANVPPLTEQTRQVGGPSHYVLELRARRAAELGIAAGTRLQIQSLPDAQGPP